MPRLDYTNDDQIDERLNPASELNALESAASDNIDSETIHHSSKYSNEENAQSQVDKLEKSSNDNLSLNYQPARDGGENQPRSNTKFSMAKKRGGIIGLIAIFGVTGGIFAAFLGPASMLINLTENFSIGNDSSSTAMQRRFMKAFANATSDSDLCKGPSKLRCKMGRISNNALRKMAKKGVIPLDKSGNPMNTERLGFPAENPKRYRIDAGNGVTHTVEANEMTEFLNKKENRRLAAKILGHRGAFNLRVRAWSGKYLFKRFYSKFNIDKRGGIASTLDRKLTMSERMKKFREKIPGSSKISEVGDRVKDKVNNNLSKGRRAGTAYLISMAGCIGVKTPGYIAGGVAAVQLAQIMPYVMDLVLSPGSKAKASGVTGGFTAEDAEVAGNLLTERTPRQSDGKLGSALDSPYLLYAMGASSSKPKVSEQFTPGYSTLLNPVVKESRSAAAATEPACNVIMSPTAMYTAMGVDAAVTAAASATIIGGLVKVAASWIIGEIIQKTVERVASEKVKEVLTDLAKNDKIPSAKGQDLGDVIGISAAAFFSSGSMSRHIPVLKESGVSAFNQMKIENEQFNKEMDIASLSPFDTSSRYTFLGSILYGMRENMIKVGSYNNSFASIASNILRIPSMVFTMAPGVNAATNFSKDYCGYAKDFDLEANENTPAINMSGLPCTGLTPAQDSMTTEQAISLLEQEGWIDGNIENEIADGATIEDLMELNIIKRDNPLSDFIEHCSNPDTGDYLFNAAGCTVDETGTDNNLNEIEVAKVCDTKLSKDEDGNETSSEVCSSKELEDFTDQSIIGIKDRRSMDAISVFLLDYQIIQSMNGEDEEDAPANTESFDLGTPENIDTKGKGWSLKPDTDYSSIPCADGTDDAGIFDVAIGSRKSKIKLCKVTVEGHTARVASLISGNIKAMMEAARGDGIILVPGSDFRSYEDQVKLRRSNGCPDLTSPSRTCRVPTSPPGKSEHERGLAVDWSWNKKPGAFCFPRATCAPGENAAYDWMVANSTKYGFHKLSIEAWHFSTSGY